MIVLPCVVITTSMRSYCIPASYTPYNILETKFVILVYILYMVENFEGEIFAVLAGQNEATKMSVGVVWSDIIHVQGGISILENFTH